MIFRAVAILAVISLIAAIAAWIPVFFNFEPRPDWGMGLFWPVRLFPIALAGSFGIGFPIALTVFLLARKQLAQSFSSVVLIASLSSVMIALTALILGDMTAAFFFGVPTLFASLTYALLGWWWLLLPIREAASDDLQV